MMKKVIRPALFLLIGVLLFLRIQSVLMPKNTDRMGYVINGFKSLENDSIDALFLGDSHLLYGVSSMKIYEDTGIKAYSLASAAQKPWLSYGILEMVFRTQHPKVVVLTATSLFSHDYREYKTEFEEDALNIRNNNYCYRIFDMLPVGIDKISIIKEYLNAPYNDGILTPLIPMIKYHERWQELTEDDFRPVDTRGLYYSAGESVGVGINPGITTIEQANDIADLLTSMNVGHTTVFNGETTDSTALTTPMYQPIIQQGTADDVLKIRQLCEKNGAELVLLAVPEAYFLPLEISLWTREEAEMAKEFADEHDIGIIDLVYDYDYDIIDLSADTYDGGVHLNVRGAEKVATALEPILQAKIPENSRVTADYDEMLEVWKHICKVAYLEMETDFTAYIDRLAQFKDQCAIYIAACDDYTQGMTPEDYDFLKEKLGFCLIEDGELADAYIAVLDRGELIYEELSDRRITHEMDILDSGVTLVSSGTFTNQKASVKIDGIEYALSRAGLNIVVYDYETGLIIDVSAINTQHAEKPVFHGDVQPLFNTYEAAMRAVDHE